MADLSPAVVKVTLNVAEAKRAIEDLRREIRSSVPVAVQGGSAVKAAVVKKTNPKAGHPNVSGDVGDDPYFGDNPYFTHDNVADGIRLLKWLKTTDRMRKFAPIHIQKSAEDASLINRGVSKVEGALGLDAASVGTVAGVGLAAAAVAAAVHTVGNVAPDLARALKASGVPVPEGVTKFLDDFQAVIGNFEHRISNIVKAPKEAFDLWAGGARITGQLPDFLYYWNQAYDIGVAEDDLAAKFDHFKRNEVAVAIGKGVGETFQKSFDR